MPFVVESQGQSRPSQRAAAARSIASSRPNHQRKGPAQLRLVGQGNIFVTEPAAIALCAGCLSRQQLRSGQCGGQPLICKTMARAKWMI